MKEVLQSFARSSLDAPDLSIEKLTLLSGGCINQAARMDTSHGPYFVKWNSRLPGTVFAAEAEGLKALRGSGSSLRIPEVMGLSRGGDGTPPMILLEYLDPVADAREDGTSLGRGLAEIHARKADTFGFHCDTYCGATRQPNGEMEDWAEFYRARRLEPLLQEIEARRGLPAREAGIYARVLEKLPELLSHRPRPALIHGDLWSGNRLRTRKGPAIIDPAAYRADREMEFSIMLMFGGFEDSVIEAYQEALPLDAGWKDRLGLYQLYHYLNHHLLFGGSYGGTALNLASRYL